MVRMRCSSYWFWLFSGIRISLSEVYVSSSDTRVVDLQADKTAQWQALGLGVLKLPYLVIYVGNYCVKL